MTIDCEGNSVVNSGTAHTGLPSDPSTDMLIEANRLETFKDWPNPNITPESLAKAGFYYFNLSDQARCVWCKGVIAKWEKNDNAYDSHLRFFPNCPRYQITGKYSEELAIQLSTYSGMEARLRTFLGVESGKALAEAGFYFNISYVVCFHCHIGLRKWEEGDDPWREHAKISPKCQFVLRHKGPDYVRQVNESAAASRETVSLEDHTVFKGAVLEVTEPSSTAADAVPPIKVAELDRPQSPPPLVASSAPLTKTPNLVDCSSNPNDNISLQ